MIVRLVPNEKQKRASRLNGILFGGRKPRSLQETYGALVARRSISSSGCWEFTGCLSESGYGVISYNGVGVVAHRVSWMTHNGKIPAGIKVCHRCDNRKCFNPKHLFLGSAADNNADCRSKGRASPPPHPALPSPAQIREIKRLYAPYRFGVPKVAKALGMKFSTVRDVIFPPKNRVGRHNNFHGST